VFILDHSLRIVIAAAAVGVVLVAFRVRSGAARHAAWTAVLVAMLTMPALTTVVPRVDVPVPSTLVLDPGAIAVGAVPEFSDVASSLANPVTSASQGSSEMAVARVEPSARPGDHAGWKRLLLSVYGLGLLYFTTRLVAGWLIARRLTLSATETGLKARTRVVESSIVAAPLTTGIFSPVVVLPRDWRGWPDDTLRAVLAHEEAHVARRDCLVLLLVQINRVVFWFHPLAWWLARTLVVNAEHACDELVVGRLGQPRRYAEILVEMAAAVSRRRSRVAWPAMGVDGSGLLATRIDRVLRTDAFARMSPARRGATVAACAGILLAAIACRQQVAATPLRPDPEVAKRLADSAERTRRFAASRDMTVEQVDALETRIAANPEDWDARERLVTYYWRGTEVPWDRKVPGLRRHALWLIEHAPEHEIAAPPLSPEYDPEGFAAAVRLWDAQLQRPDASPFLIYRAAQFFLPYDKPRAEALILRGMKIDPQSDRLKRRMPANVAGYAWPSQLASLYAATLAGNRGISSREASVEAARSPFAMEVRRKLESSPDAELLARVGNDLIRLARFQHLTGTDAGSLGRSYLERAAALAPTSSVVQRAIDNLTRAEKQARVHSAIARGETVPDDDRLAYLAATAEEAYSLAEFQTDYRKKAAAAEQKITQAREAAEQILTIASRNPQSPSAGGGVFVAQLTLGLIALREGSRERAVERMRNSVAISSLAPSFDHGLGFRLANYLLQAGERESVAAFFDRYADLSPGRREALRQEAAAIREGRMPESYQRMFASGDGRR
jgi:hypothetical protein